MRPHEGRDAEITDREIPSLTPRRRIRAPTPPRRIRARHALIVTVISLLGLPAILQPVTAAPACHTSGPTSGTYNVKICMTSPADGATLTGLQTVSAKVTVTGTNPGIRRLVFYFGGAYLLTDFASPYTFTLETPRWIDATYSLEVEAAMRDGFTTERTTVTVTLSNGVTTPPVNNATFTPSTGTVPSAGQPLVLAAVGDGAGGESSAANVTNLIASWSPNLLLYLGDVYEKGTSTEFANWYGTPSTFFGRFRPITDPTVGNHEYEGGVAPGYFDYWDNVPHYYSVDAGGWHFISLDSTSQFNQTAPGTTQYQWLQADLAASTAACTLVYFHHPVYSVGAQGDTVRLGPIWSLLYQNGVDVVLTGHDHNYQRWRPLDASGSLDPNGVTEFVVGTGGHGILNFVSKDSRLAVGYDTAPNAYGALRMALQPDGASYVYVNQSGTTLDSGSLTCSGALNDTTPPSAPTLTAAATGPSRVDLSWTAATDNAGVAAYDVYRDTALLASVGGSTTAYADTTVGAETTYTYEVRARDAAGNTTPSNDATVTTPSAATPLFADGFETGDLSQWTSQTGMTVQQAEVFAGAWAARMTSSGVATYATKNLSTGQTELYYRTRLKVVSMGANSVNLLKFRTGTGTSILGLYVGSTGKLSVRNDVAAVSTASTTVVSTGAWHDVQVHLLINGASSQTDVWYDGVKVPGLSLTQSFGTTPIGRIQLGENSTARIYDVAFDEMALATALMG